MNTEDAIRVLRALASGRSPEDGKSVADEHLVRRPIVVKALNRGLAALVKLEKAERAKPQNAFRYWSREEVAKVCEEVQQGMDFHEIAKRHNRSVSSIVARLIKLGKVKAPPAKAA